MPQVAKSFHFSVTESFDLKQNPSPKDIAGSDIKKKKNERFMPDISSYIQERVLKKLSQPTSNGLKWPTKCQPRPFYSQCKTQPCCVHPLLVITGSKLTKYFYHSIALGIILTPYWGLDTQADVWCKTYLLKYSHCGLPILQCGNDIKLTNLLPACLLPLQKSICYFDNCICHPSCNCWLDSPLWQMVQKRAGKFAKASDKCYTQQRALFPCKDPCHVNCT